MCRRCLFQIFGNVESYVCGHRHHGAIELSVAKIFTFDANILSKARIDRYAIKRFQVFRFAAGPANSGVRNYDVHGFTTSIRGGVLPGGDLRAFEPPGAILPRLRPIVSIEPHWGSRYLNLLSTHSYPLRVSNRLCWRDNRLDR